MAEEVATSASAAAAAAGGESKVAADVPTILGMGNPLLDISTTVDTAYLAKYELAENLAVLAEEKHLPIYAEIVKNGDVEYVAGGATQNSIRIAQWMLGEPQTAFIGCVGKDGYSETLGKMVKQGGVRAQYMVDEATPTGTCAVLITGKHRTLVANIAAANSYKEEHVAAPENWALVEAARIFYISGFFLTVSPETILRVADHAASANKTFCMNLAAPFISQVPIFCERLMKCIEFCDVLFGNETEAEAFSQAASFNTTDLKEIALKIAAMPKKNAARPRIVVITHGHKPTTVAVDGKVTEYPVNLVPKDDIVDTNGAGDAFVGGFLAKLVKGGTVEEAVHAGSWSASVVIQRSGATVPDTCEYKQ